MQWSNEKKSAAFSIEQKLNIRETIKQKNEKSSRLPALSLSQHEIVVWRNQSTIQICWIWRKVCLDETMKIRLSCENCFGFSLFNHSGKVVDSLSWKSMNLLSLKDFSIIEKKTRTSSLILFNVFKHSNAPSQYFSAVYDLLNRHRDQHDIRIDKYFPMSTLTTDDPSLSCCSRGKILLKNGINLHTIDLDQQKSSLLQSRGDLKKLIATTADPRDFFLLCIFIFIFNSFSFSSPSHYWQKTNKQSNGSDFQPLFIYIRLFRLHVHFFRYFFSLCSSARHRNEMQRESEGTQFLIISTPSPPHSVVYRLNLFKEEKFI